VKVLDYYRILNLTPGASLSDIKKAYRQKAFLYHPDVSKNPDTQEQFVLATEAYDFLISYKNRINANRPINPQAATDWQKRWQADARKKAYAYASCPYSTFKKSELYKTTVIFNTIHATLVLLVSLTIIIVAIHGYFYRLNNPIPGVMERPPLVFSVAMVILGTVGIFMAFGKFLNRKK